ncbi:DsbA family protein [Patescibacteria group bacterium]|nr:DsbA family protein [Patescibacteria group bacterium]
MEENTQQNQSNMAESSAPVGTVANVNNKNNGQLAGSIIVAGIIIAGAILLKGSGPSTAQLPNTGTTPPAVAVAKIDSNDRVLGNPNAKVDLIVYEDYQCPFCGRFTKDTESVIRSSYVADGRVRFAYRDYAFLGAESTAAAMAARCANDQGKFWEYHDYLFTHQNGENQGNFNATNLLSYATSVGLDKDTFTQCLTSNKYSQAVADSTAQGNSFGVRGTPKGFILKNGKVVDTIDGAIPTATVTAKLDAALK